MPGQRIVPTIWVAPVRSHCTPMTISPLDWANDGAAVRPTARVSAVTKDRTCLMSVLLSSRSSVRERPNPEVVADVPPQPVQPVGLHDQEEDDQGAEQHEAEVGDEVEHGLRVEEHAAENFHGAADDDRQ